MVGGSLRAGGPGCAALIGLWTAVSCRLGPAACFTFQARRRGGRSPGRGGGRSRLSGAGVVAWARAPTRPRAARCRTARAGAPLGGLPGRATETCALSACLGEYWCTQLLGPGSCELNRWHLSRRQGSEHAGSLGSVVWMPPRAGGTQVWVGFGDPPGGSGSGTEGCLFTRLDGGLTSPTPRRSRSRRTNCGTSPGRTSSGSWTSSRLSSSSCAWPRSRVEPRPSCLRCNTPPHPLTPPPPPPGRSCPLEPPCHWRVPRGVFLGRVSLYRSSGMRSNRVGPVPAVPD